MTLQKDLLYTLIVRQHLDLYTNHAYLGHAVAVLSISSISSFRTLATDLYNLTAIESFDFVLLI